MSDPVSKAEIEDVLSSIRRLVSEESRADPRGTVKRDGPELGRLVLTPSLRVADGVDLKEPAEDVAPEAFLLEAKAEVQDVSDNVNDASSDTATCAESTDSEPWRDPGATLFATARTIKPAEFEVGDDESDGAGDDGTYEDPQDYDDTEDYDAQEFDASEEQGEAREIADDETVDDDFVNVEDVDDLDDLGGESGDASEELQGAQNDEDLPPADVDFVVVPDEVDADSDWQEQDTQDQPKQDQPEQDQQQEARQEIEQPFEPARAETLSAKIQALEAAIGRTKDQWEPDGEGVDDYAGTRVETIAWEDHSDDDSAETSGSAAPAVEVEQAEEPTDVLSADEAFLDEESLRELVADIVREELQGALGERITRNVRKLVRREIHRALSAQELE